MSQPVPFHDLKVEDFPFCVEFIDADTDEVLHSITVDEPGVVEVPGWGGKRRVGVKVTYATGEVIVQDPL